MTGHLSLVFCHGHPIAYYAIPIIINSHSHLMKEGGILENPEKACKRATNLQRKRIKKMIEEQQMGGELDTRKGGLF